MYIHIHVYMYIRTCSYVHVCLNVHQCVCIPLTTQTMHLTRTTTFSLKCTAFAVVKPLAHLGGQLRSEP